MTDYNYDVFKTAEYEFDNIAGPNVGEKAPDFTLTTSSGESKRLLDFDGEFLVLEMGSITCPLFQSRRTIMTPLSSAFKQISSAVVYVREAHPGDIIQKHTSFEDKQACAARLTDEDGEKRLVFVDSFEGCAHRAYGSMPNAVYIINRNGCVVFRSDWNNPTATRKAVIALIEGKEIRVKSYFRPGLPTTSLRTFRNAGKGSASDFFKGLPFLIWTNIVKRNLRLLFNRPASGTSHTDC